MDGSAGTCNENKITPFVVSKVFIIRCNVLEHAPTYLTCLLLKMMEKKYPSLKTIDEMWNELEKFGIKRETLQLRNTSYREIEEIYLILKRMEESNKTNHIETTRENNRR